jgi:hypothetical protein
MRLWLLGGLLGLSLSLGALFGLATSNDVAAIPSDPLVEEYVRLVGALYAKGESLSLAEARLHGITPSGDYSFVARAATGNGVAAGSESQDLAAVLTALAPKPQPTATLPPRLAASGRGSDPTPTRADATAAATEVAVDFPLSGRVSATKGDASLRTKPALNGAVLRIIPRGSEIVLLGVEQGQAVEGAEDRWYRVKHAEATGYIYFTLVEPGR